MNNQIEDADYHMRMLVDRVPTMLAYWDSDLKCKFANRAYETWFGVNPDQLIDTHDKDLLGPALFALNEPLMRKALAGERQLFERMVPGPGGVIRPSLAEYIPVMVNGVARGFLVQVTNLTELKETQNALLRETQLRLQLAAQTVKLQAMLDERTEMLDILAHEVRQPLNNAAAVLQSAQVTLNATGDVFASEQVVLARGVLSEVLNSLDNTLAVAALLARPEQIQRDDADIDTWIAVVITDMRPASRNRIEVMRETSTRTALMDMSLMRLALRNLLSNALKFSPEQSKVSLRISDVDHPPALRIDVIDAGTGVPTEVLSKLFTRGVHGGAREHGHGLGLYIVDRVMAMHEGNVELLKTGSEGSTFRLTITQNDFKA